MVMRNKRKRHFLTCVAAVTCLGCTGQSAYLNAGRSEVMLVLAERGIEVMQEDSAHVHSVDSNSLRNVIAHFKKGVCTSVVTTFQKPEDFDKVVEFMNRRYESTGTMSWRVGMDGGSDRITGHRRNGYDVIEETFVESEKKE